MAQRISIERIGATVDSYGQPVETWTVLASRRASVSPLSAKEYLSNTGEHTNSTVKIYLRYDSLLADLSDADRVVHGTDVYDIESVINPRSANREFILMAVLRE